MNINKSKFLSLALLTSAFATLSPLQAMDENENNRTEERFHTAKDMLNKHFVQLRYKSEEEALRERTFDDAWKELLLNCQKKENSVFFKDKKNIEIDINHVTTGQFYEILTSNGFSADSEYNVRENDLIENAALNNDVFAKEILKYLDSDKNKEFKTKIEDNLEKLEKSLAPKREDFAKFDLSIRGGDKNDFSEKTFLDMYDLDYDTHEGEASTSLRNIVGEYKDLNAIQYTHAMPEMVVYGKNAKGLKKNDPLTEMAELYARADEGTDTYFRTQLETNKELFGDVIGQYSTEIKKADRSPKTKFSREALKVMFKKALIEAAHKKHEGYLKDKNSRSVDISGEVYSVFNRLQTLIRERTTYRFGKGYTEKADRIEGKAFETAEISAHPFFMSANNSSDVSELSIYLKSIDEGRINDIRYNREAKQFSGFESDDLNNLLLRLQTVYGFASGNKEEVIEIESHGGGSVNPDNNNIIFSVKVLSGKQQKKQIFVKIQKLESNTEKYLLNLEDRAAQGAQGKKYKVSRQDHFDLSKVLNGKDIKGNFDYIMSVAESGGSQLFGKAKKAWLGGDKKDDLAKIYNNLAKTLVKAEKTELKPWKDLIDKSVLEQLRTYFKTTNVTIESVIDKDPVYKAALNLIPTQGKEDFKANYTKMLEEQLSIVKKFVYEKGGEREDERWNAVLGYKVPVALGYGHNDIGMSNVLLTGDGRQMRDLTFIDGFTDPNVPKTLLGHIMSGMDGGKTRLDAISDEQVTRFINSWYLIHTPENLFDKKISFSQTKSTAAQIIDSILDGAVNLGNRVDVPTQEKRKAETAQRFLRLLNKMYKKALNEPSKSPLDFGINAYYNFSSEAYNDSVSRSEQILRGNLRRAAELTSVAPEKTKASQKVAQLFAFTLETLLKHSGADLGDILIGKDAENLMKYIKNIGDEEPNFEYLKQILDPSIGFKSFK